MANYPPHQVQADLKELMHSAGQEWFRDCVLLSAYRRIMVSNPSAGMTDENFYKMLDDQSKVPCSWIERRLDTTKHNGKEVEVVSYRIRNGACYLGDDCSFSPLYAKVSKILSWKRDHNWIK